MVSENHTKSNCIYFLLSCLILSRFIIFFILGLVSLTFSYIVPARDEPMLHSISNVDFGIAFTHFKNILLSADASWYLEIAHYGYPAREYTNSEALHWVFFPLFPILINLVHLFTGSFLLAALLLNFSCLLISLLCINKYLENENFSQNSIKWIMALICFHPLSYFFSTPHSESTFLLCLSATLLYIQKKSLSMSALAFGLCMIARPTGILISPGIALLAKKRGLPVIPFAMLSSIPFLSFTAYLGKITGNPFAWIQNQGAWGRVGSFFDLMSFQNLNLSNLIVPWSINILHLAFLGLLGFVIFFQIKEKAWGFLLINLLPVLSALSSGTLLSISRIIMPLIVVPITLTKNLKEHNIILLILIYSFLLGAMTLLYALRTSFAMT